MVEGCGWVSVCWQRIPVWTGVTRQEGVGFQEAEPANPSTEKKRSVDLGMLKDRVLHPVFSVSSYWEMRRVATSQLNQTGYRSHQQSRSDSEAPRNQGPTCEN